MFVLAHAGHWFVSFAYLMPLVVLGIVVIVGKYQHRDDDEAATDVQENASHTTDGSVGAKKEP